MTLSINTIGAPGFGFLPRCSADRGRRVFSQSHAAPALFHKPIHDPRDNVVNPLNCSSPPFVSVLHANKHGEIECAKTCPGWTGK